VTTPGAGDVRGISPAEGHAAAAMPRRSGLFRRVLRNPTAIVCLFILAIFVLASIFAPLLATHSPTRSSLNNSLAPLSTSHLLGGDGVGRDVFARLLYGGRVSLLGAFIAVAVALLIGVPTGLLSGYYRGWVDAVGSWVANLIMAAPAIIVLLVAIAAIGPNTNAAMAVLGVILAPGVFRLVRSSVTAVREELYVDAARVSGLSDLRIARRHILPVVQAPTIIQAAQMFGVAIVIQAGIEFLGLGSPDEASWGAMLNDAFNNLYLKPTLLLWPGLAIIITVAALGLLGNALRDALLESGYAVPKRRIRRARPAAAAAPEPLPPPTIIASAPPSEIDTATLLVVSNLTVAYPSHNGESVVVDNVSFTVRRGEVLGLVGESGSGKSQTAFSILGLLPPEARRSAGWMSFDGNDLQRLGRKGMNALRGARIAYVPQEPMSNLDPSFRIGSQLVEPMRQHLKISAAEAKTRAIALLERVGIDDPARVYRAYPHQISGGMAQRVLIAGAVSCDPDLLIADEPTTALDVTVQAEVLDLMRELQQERQMGMILVTHNFGVVADICDRVAVMQAGKIVEAAPAQQLFTDPQHAYTRMLLASTLEDAPARAPLHDNSAARPILLEKS
jgi:peptide/nickel transport system permease protein